MKIYQKFRDSCNANIGVIELFALIIFIITLIPFNDINLKDASTLFQNILLLVTYKIKIPVYAFLILFLFIFIYYRRIRFRYKTSSKQDSNFDFLVGTWKNTWGSGNRRGSEICRITKDGKYFVKDVLYFIIKDLKIDSSTGEITFTKVRVKPNDKSEWKNSLMIVNNSKLKGKENDLDIIYTRIV